MLSNIEYIISKIVKKLHFKAVKNSFVHRSSSIGQGSSFIESTMDRNSFCGYDCTIVKSKIGSFCSIASNCEIGGANHTIDWVSTSPVFNINKDQIRKKYSHFEFDPMQQTKIGNDVWIGANCLIKSGVTIGDGAIIGMGSVVTKNVPPYTIVAGIPAKVIRNRFEESITKDLLELRWWDMEDSKLKKYAQHIKDPAIFIREVKKCE